MHKGHLILAGIGIAASTAAVAQGDNAATAADAVRRVCEPLLLFAGTRSSEFLSDEQTQRSYFNHICSLDVRSAEEARQRGVDVNVVIKGVPVGFLWSDNTSRRSQARTAFCSMTRDQSQTSSLISLAQRSGNPEVLGQYNSCVDRTLQYVGGTALSCRFQDMGQSDLALLRVSYIKATSDPNPVVSSASLVNGIVPPPANDILGVTPGANDTGRLSLPPITNPAQVTIGNRVVDLQASYRSLPLVGQALTPGTRLFVVHRQEPGLPTSVVVNASNGLTCSEKIDSSYHVQLRATITPTGADIVPASHIARIEKGVDCDGHFPSSDGGVHEPFDVCLPDDNAIASTVNVSVSSSSGDSQVRRWELHRNNRKNCATAFYSVHGKGYGTSFGNVRDCRGTGWLVADIAVSGTVPANRRSLPSVTQERGKTVNFQNSIFNYQEMAPVPTGFNIQSWRYSVTVTETGPRGATNIELSEAFPKRSGFTSMMHNGQLSVYREDNSTPPPPRPLLPERLSADLLTQLQIKQESLINVRPDLLGPAVRMGDVELRQILQDRRQILDQSEQLQRGQLR